MVKNILKVVVCALSISAACVDDVDADVFLLGHNTSTLFSHYFYQHSDNHKEYRDDVFLASPTRELRKLRVRAKKLRRNVSRYQRRMERASGRLNKWYGKQSQNGSTARNRKAVRRLQRRLSRDDRRLAR